MSTKIYNGIRFKSRSLDGVYANLVDIRASIQEKQKAAKLKFLANETILIVDRNALGLSSEQYPLSSAHGDFRDRQREIKKTGHSDPSVDFDFSISLIPFNKRVYGMVYCEQRSWIEWLLSNEWIEDYSFWNNADKPENLSSRQWNTRRKIWDGIFKDDSRPVNVGLDFCVLPHDEYVKEADILSYAPGLDERASKVARSILLNEYIMNNSIPNNDFVAVIKADRWIMDNPSILENKTQEIKSLLPILDEKIILGWQR